jgi:hypothetical protein
MTWHVEETSTGWWLVKADGFRITMIDERFAREAAAFYNRVTDLGYDMVRTPPMTASWHEVETCSHVVNPPGQGQDGRCLKCGKAIY